MYTLLPGTKSFSPFEIIKLPFEALLVSTASLVDDVHDILPPYVAVTSSPYWFNTTKSTEASLFTVTSLLESLLSGIFLGIYGAVFVVTSIFATFSSSAVSVATISFSVTPAVVIV